MTNFIKQYLIKPARQRESYVEYRGLQELDKNIEQAKLLLDSLDLDYEITKIPELRGFSIKFL